LTLQPSGALEGVLPSFERVVLAAVDLDHKFVLEGDKVDDVRADGSLPAELNPAELAGAKLLPEELLGLCGRTPQPASTLNLVAVQSTMMVQIAPPHRNPLLHGGKRKLKVSKS